MAKLDIDGYEYAYLKAIVLFSPGKHLIMTLFQYVSLMLFRCFNTLTLAKTVKKLAAHFLIHLIWD